jgi:hypothetical protein
MNRTAFAAFALVATLALAGCAPSAEPVAEPDVPVVTPTPTRAPETGTAKPAQAFGGDCAQVLTDAQLIEIFGAYEPREPHSNPTNANTRPDGSLVTQLGGVNCHWSDGTESATYGLQASVVPAVSIETAAVTLRGCPYGEMEPSCEFSTTASGLTFSGVLYGPTGATPAKLESIVADLTGVFADNATSQIAYLPPIQAATAWPLDFDCASVVGIVKAGTNNPALTYDEHGFNAYPTPVERALWGSRETLACTWMSKTTQGSSEFSYFAFNYLGGAAWAADRTGRPIEVEGVDFAGLSDESGIINVVDGVNWMQVDVAPGHDAETTATISALVAALNSLSN